MFSFVLFFGDAKVTILDAGRSLPIKVTEVLLQDVVTSLVGMAGLWEGAEKVRGHVTGNGEEARVTEKAGE